MSALTLFCGHRIDAPDRPSPRFPADRAEAAQRVILERLRGGRAVSSLANGGDILFAEACRALNIPLDLFLPMAVETFVDYSVRCSFDGTWEQRFYKLWSETPPSQRHILAPPDGVNPFGFCNDAMLAFAQAHSHSPRLIALWNGQTGDGPGGTGDLVRKADAAGFDITIINPGEL